MKRTPLKVAISGKGGVGKSTLAAALALLAARQGRKVLAVDADPDANLAACLGMPEAARRQIVPISQRRALVEQRTGAKVREYGQIFKLNPDVSDIADSFAAVHEGVALLVLGAVEQGGGGCACPENVLLRALVADLLLHRDEMVIMDMEAGVEHLGRATARSVDTLVVVVEPGQRAIDSAKRVMGLAADIGLSDIRLVANKVTSEDDERFLSQALEGLQWLGTIPHSEDLRRADRDARSVLDAAGPELQGRFQQIMDNLTAP